MINGVVEDGVSPLDRGLAFGDGLFETLRLSQGVIPLLDRHLSRLKSSCLRLHIPLDLTLLRAHLARFLSEIAGQGVASGAIKLIHTRGQGGRGYYPPLLNATHPTTLFIFHAFEHGDPQPVALQVLEHRLSHNPYLAGMKHLNRLEYVLAAQSTSWEAAVGELHGLLLDVNGMIVEAMHHNVFAIQNGQLLTPELTHAGVRGVMRTLIMDTLADSLSLGVTELPMRIESLIQADEVFVCNSLRGIQPVIKQHQHSWPVGPLTKRLQRRLNAFWSGHADS